jgi:predicted transcriptional regulator of viral defense system
MKLFEIQERLAQQGFLIFSSQEFRRAVGVTPGAAKMLLVRYVKKGYVLQLKGRRGLYGLKSRPPHPWLLANRLLRPSYVSLETALSHYGHIPESVHAVTSVSPKTTRTFQSLGLSFNYQKVKQTAFTGYQSLQVDGQSVWIAEPEKAAADYLYFVHLGRKNINDRFRWKGLDRAKILRYLQNFGRDRLKSWASGIIPK